MSSLLVSNIGKLAMTNPLQQHRFHYFHPCCRPRSDIFPYFPWAFRIDNYAGSIHSNWNLFSYLTVASPVSNNDTDYTYFPCNCILRRITVMLICPTSPGEIMSPFDGRTTSHLDLLLQSMGHPGSFLFVRLLVEFRFH